MIKRSAIIIFFLLLACASLYRLGDELAKAKWAASTTDLALALILLQAIAELCSTPRHPRRLTLAERLFAAREQLTTRAVAFRLSLFALFIIGYIAQTVEISR